MDIHNVGATPPYQPSGAGEAHGPQGAGAPSAITTTALEIAKFYADNWMNGKPPTPAQQRAWYNQLTRAAENNPALKQALQSHAEAMQQLKNGIMGSVYDLRPLVLVVATFVTPSSLSPSEALQMSRGLIDVAKDNAFSTNLSTIDGLKTLKNTLNLLVPFLHRAHAVSSMAIIQNLQLTVDAHIARGQGANLQEREWCQTRIFAAENSLPSAP